MKLEECIDLLFEGKKLKRNIWSQGEYIHLVDGKIVTEIGCSVFLNSYLSNGYVDWKVYDEAKMDIPDAFWEMVDPKWNYLFMYYPGGWYLSRDCPILKDEAWQGGGEYLKLTLSHFDWYKDPEEDWTKTLYKRPGVE